MSKQENIAQALVAQFNLRVHKEGVERIQKCLGLLTDEQIWQSPSVELNSIGNLVLHLCGNVTQWIGSGIGNMEDRRTRTLEFVPESRCSRKILFHKLSDLRSVTDESLCHITDANLLTAKRVQGFEETYLSILIHVIEHFSYHVGQIAYITKQITNQQVGFYDKVDLNVTH